MWLEHHLIGKAEAPTEQLLRGPAALISSRLKRPEKMLIIQPVDIWDSHLLNELQFLSPEEKETNKQKIPTLSDEFFKTHENLVFSRFSAYSELGLVVSMFREW